jgi:disulfide bond formation protein DsbB
MALGVYILVTTVLFILALYYGVMAVIHTVLWLIMAGLGFKKKGNDVVWSADGPQIVVIFIVYFIIFMIYVGS